MAKAVKAKLSLCMREFQRYEEQDIEVLDDPQLWNELRGEIEGLKSDLRDSNLACGDDSDDMYQSFIGMKDTTIDILAKIRRLMVKSQESRESLKIEDCSRTGVSGLSSLRLPGLELPTFDGDLGIWLTFREVFTATIDTDKDLSEASKFGYLIGAFKGDPAKLVSGFLMSKLHVGELVAIHESTSPPLTWRLGSIKETYPGPDGLVLVVLIHTQDGDIKRPIVKVTRLISDS
ncbi:hypothetical protein AVEN_15448-1 [Araneus ventricosus]|uniref:DUF5641 domain-containing protein n=1 Tax=Araneus ventricosus TaxID=182803 RepID=A0A4Y2EED9_ARAVE|nr:hypothetical protein AVEN_15448-1 [Araneus ventricosus]